MVGRCSFATHLQNILLIGIPASTSAAQAALSAQDSMEPSQRTSCIHVQRTGLALRGAHLAASLL